MLDFHGFVDQTNNRLDMIIGNCGHNVVWCTETVDYVEYRREGQRVLLKRHSPSSAVFTRFDKDRRQGSAETVIMDKDGASRLVEVILEHTNARHASLAVMRPDQNRALT